MANVRDLLATKSSVVYTVGESVSVLEATRIMNQHQIGALVVTRGHQVVGMFTERDVLVRVVVQERDPVRTAVRDVMTGKVVCCHADAKLHDIRSLMMERRIRHVPVLDDNGWLCGLVSIGDLNAWNLRDGEVTIAYMSDYIYGRT